MSETHRRTCLTFGVIDELGSESDLRPDPRLYEFKVSHVQELFSVMSVSYCLVVVKKWNFSILFPVDLLDSWCPKVRIRQARKKPKEGKIISDFKRSWKKRVLYEDES